MEYKSKTIYCPECGRKIFVYDGRGTMSLSRKCEKCNKIVNYDPETDLVKTARVPIRQTSSGKRFW